MFNNDLEQYDHNMSECQPVAKQQDWSRVGDQVWSSIYKARGVDWTGRRKKRERRERGEVGWRSGSQRDLRERERESEKTESSDRIPAGELKVGTHL